jgi:ectoine hydroxylase-related dioxygenase (phytanoyl-CoA dioxygenase family)
MLTLRIHLDEVTDENGPLKVIPGTHRQPDPGKDTAPVSIHAAIGDVLAMRPLLSHSSGASLPGTTRHRRILHLEFAADRILPDGYQWRHFITADSA